MILLDFDYIAATITDTLEEADLLLRAAEQVEQVEEITLDNLQSALDAVAPNKFGAFVGSPMHGFMYNGLVYLLNADGNWFRAKLNIDENKN